MTEINQIYKCAVCGNIVQVLHAGQGELVCCGQPMRLQTENSVDASLEKHVPVVEKTAGGVKIKVGSVPHPMEEAHYIEWIQVVAGGIAQRKYLKPGEAPEAEFCVSGDVQLVRAYCNLHGLWKS
jgi:superoxide reductase